MPADCKKNRQQPMIPLSEQITIPGPPAVVWPLLRDPALVASCIPGAALTSQASDGVYQGTVTVKFGPTVAVFRGEATLTYDDAAHRCAIEGRGVDQRGASRVLVSSVVTATGTDTTTVNMEGGFSVTGPLEMFAQAGGVHVARALLAEFGANIAKVVAQRRATPEAAGGEPIASGTPLAARELSAGNLLWQTIRTWFRRIFSRT